MPPSCWAATAGGPPGASLPVGNDDVRIVQTTGSSELRVPFAGAGRTAPQALVNSLLLQGSASFAAGLAMDRGSLEVGRLSLGQAGQAGRGLLQLSGGTLKAQDLLLRAGRLDLSGGTLNAGDIELASQGSAAQLNQTGGSLAAGRITLASAQGQEASWSLVGGSARADAVTLGAAKGTAAARWTVGQGATGTVNGVLVVGGAGSGQLGVQGGSQLVAASVQLGQDAEILGEAWVRDGARLQTGALTLGGRGRGQLTLGGQGFLRADVLVLGDARGSEGRLTGTGTTAAPSVLNVVIGRGGVGHMELNAGSPELPFALQSQSLVIGELAGGDGTLKLQGTSLYMPVGRAVVGGEGRGLLEVTGGSVDLPIGPLVVGRGAGGEGQVTIRGRVKRDNTINGMDLGRRGYGLLEVLDGAFVNSFYAPITLGGEAGGRGELVIDSAARVIASRLTATGAGANRVRLLDGGQLTVVGAIELGGASQLVLDGGVLSTGTAAIGNPGSLNWRSGVLQLTRPSALDGRQMPLELDLTPGRTLRANMALAVDAGATLRLAGGQFGWVTSTVGSLALQDGSRLEARDTLDARIDGAAGSWIQATGGLAIGSATAADGFATAGVLRVGGARVELRDADAATLGVQTRVTDGGLLHAANGLWLPAGGVLVGEGQARVEGALRSDGEVVAASGRLSFAGAVSGEGGWLGNLRFEAGFDPGDRQVARTFAGDLEIPDGSWLKLDIVGPEPRLGHDQLTEIRTLTLDGALQLVFAPGFAADQGVRLQLLSFQHFAGVLDAADVQVQGLPAWRVDWSSLPLDGSITVAAVPEPAAAWLLLAGGALLAWRRHRESASAASARPAAR